MPTLSQKAEGHTGRGAIARPVRTSRSKTLCTRRTFLHGNREIPRPAAVAPTAMARTVNPGGTTVMHGRGKSDSSVPGKSPNNAGQEAAAEAMEGRELAKGNAVEADARRLERVPFAQATNVREDGDGKLVVRGRASPG